MLRVPPRGNGLPGGRAVLWRGGVWCARNVPRGAAQPTRAARGSPAAFAAVAAVAAAVTAAVAAAVAPSR